MSTSSGTNNGMVALQAVDLALNAVERQVAPQVEYSESDRYYAWEPLPANVFISGLREIGDSAGRSLVDAGCGIGTKLVVAREFGWQNLYGVERRAEYVAHAKQMCPNATITVGQIEDHDFSSYDVVYMFQPAREPSLETWLEHHVVSRMRPGAIAFMPHAALDEIAARITDHLWQVG